MIWLSLAATAVMAAITAYWFTGRIVVLLQRRQILDIPTQRSSHSTATPRGGGLAIVTVGAAAWIATSVHSGRLATDLPVMALWLALSGLSFVDDLRGLSVTIRFLAQILAIGSAVAWLPTDQFVFQGLLPLWADRICAGLLWLWFVNLFNFMDGIDGISVVETAALGFGIALLSPLIGLSLPDPVLAAAIAGAAIGFGVLNWPPAKVFMGDVGSIGLGFMLGWLLLLLAAAGQWLPALILPLYYLADASVTLARRLVRFEPVWQAHRSHFYQRAALGFGNHAAVTLRVLALNACLVGIAGLAAIAPSLGSYCLIAAGGSCALMLWYFQRIGADADAN